MILLLLSCSILCGFGFAILSAGMASGFWAILGWYALGTWVGFGLTLGLVMALGTQSGLRRAV